MTGKKVTIKSATAKVGINPEGGCVSSWSITQDDGTSEDILYQGKTQKRTGIPVLFPYFGKAEGKRQHGFGRDFPWTVTEQQEHKVTMSLNSETIDDESRAEFPYPCAAEVTVELNDTDMFYTLRVTNTGDASMPISPGLHPYWAVSHDEKSQVTIDGIDGFDASAIDWNTTPPDNTYDYNGEVTIHLPSKTISIEDVSENAPVLKHIVVWSQTPEKDDFDFICVEPVCGKNNALHDNPVMVAAGGEWEMKLKFSVSLR